MIEEVDSASLPWSTYWPAHRMLRLCGDLLGLDPVPRIAWTTRSSLGSAGLFRGSEPRRIYVAADLPTVKDTLRVVAHEAKHAAQHQRDDMFSFAVFNSEADVQRIEREARDFEAVALQHYQQRYVWASSRR
jgi:hypothetical protein